MSKKNNNFNFIQAIIIFFMFLLLLFAMSIYSYQNPTIEHKYSLKQISFSIDKYTIPFSNEEDFNNFDFIQLNNTRLPILQKSTEGFTTSGLPITLGIKDIRDYISRVTYELLKH